MSKNNSHPVLFEEDTKKKRPFLQKFFGKKASPVSLRQELMEVLAQKDAALKGFSPEEETILTNILGLNNTRVDDIMIPRSEIEAISEEASLAEALELFEETGYSRLPVYSGSLDNPKGMIHIRDMLNYLTRQGLGHKNNQAGNLSNLHLNKKLSELNITRNLLFVPHSMLAIKLLQRMQATHMQMALVIDEHGGTDGLVSMEDLVELIVGDIEDEHDDDTPMIYSEGENSWLIDARATLEEVQNALGENFHINSFGEDVDTIGGLIVSMLDRIPARAEAIEICTNFRARIIEADKRRIRKIRIRYLAGASSQTNSKEN